MKKLLITTLLSLTLLNNAMAEQRSMVDKAMTYSIPCIGLALLGGALIKDKGFEVGLMACATYATVVFTMSEESKLEVIDNHFKKNQDKFWAEVKAYKEEQDNSLEKFKESVRRAVAEKLVEQEVNIEELVVKTLSNKEFSEIVKKQLKEVASQTGKKNAEEMKRIFKEREDEIFERVVEEFTDRLIKSNIGVSQKITAPKGE